MVNISYFRRILRKTHTGTFRMLREGEEIEAADLIVSDCYYEHPSETSIGQKVKPSETILRFTVEKK